MSVRYPCREKHGISNMYKPHPLGPMCCLPLIRCTVYMEAAQFACSPVIATLATVQVLGDCF